MNPVRPLCSPLALVLLLAVCTRAAVLATGYVSVTVADPEAFSAYATGKAMIAWDSVHYRTLVTEGYPERPSPLIAFFPLYPLLARPFTAVASPEFALLAVANVCTVVAAVFVFLWARTATDPRTALLCTALTLAYPPAMFCSAAYTEGLFLLLTALTLWLSQRQAAWPAGVVSGLATAVRPTGVALAAVVLLCTWAQAARASWLRLGFLLVLSFSGLLAYQAFLWARYDRFDSYLRAQDHWSTLSPKPPDPEKAKRLISPLDEVVPPPLNKLVSFHNWNKACVGAILLLALGGLVGPSPIPRALFLMPVIIFLLGYLPGFGARYMSLARFETAALPCFLLAAILLRRPAWAGRLVVLWSFALQLFFTYEFTRGRWLG
jgi:hypothetical protein